MNRFIIIALVAVLLLGAGKFALRRDRGATVRALPATALQTTQPTATPQSIPARQVAVLEQAPPPTIASAANPVEKVSASPNAVKDSMGRVLVEFIKSKQDSTLLKKLYAYDERGNITREMYLDLANGHIVECKNHVYRSDGNERIHITGYDGGELQDSAVQ
jgi:Sec-independent protein translocase protein TatA